MRKTLTILIILLLASCSITRKTQQSAIASNNNVSNSEATSRNASVVIDTTRSDNGTVTITELQSDTDADTAIATIEIGDLGTFDNVAIKSLKKTVIAKAIEDKGLSTSTDIQSHKTEGISESNLYSNNEVVSQPVADPKRWRYIFYTICILAICAIAAYLYIKKIPILKLFGKLHL